MAGGRSSGLVLRHVEEATPTPGSRAG
jgi:hypothetical protein